jgi:phospholipid/cholesterol/gamma-HCH transport system substrate-binding protein
MSTSVDRLNSVLAEVQNGDGLLPSLLHDSKTREQFDATLAELRGVSQNLQGFSKELREGKGLMPRLVHDKELGDEVTRELQELLKRINDVARKLDDGDGTAGKLINDPSVYDAINDVIVGVNQSRILRWLIRNRQKKGIEERYEEAQHGPPDGAGAQPDSPKRREER